MSAYYAKDLHPYLDNCGVLSDQLLTADINVES